MTQGLAVPPDVDALRDIGFAQGLRDGDWFGDPTTAGAVRYYPPLVPAIGALLAWLGGAQDLPGSWVAAGPWAGLLPVAMFHGLARRLFADAAAAACGTAVFVLLNGAAAVPWIGGGYTPWLLTPLLVQAAFLGTAWLIHARIARAGWIDAVAIGLAIGVTFLGHVVPAMLLTAMLVAAALAVHGMQWRTVAWLGLAGVVQALAMTPYLLPLLIAYPGGIVHAAPGGWTDGALSVDWSGFGGVALANIPAALAAVAAWRGRATLPRASAAMLGTWVALCLVALARHYGCGATESDTAACLVLRVPVHHFHLYLQVATAALLGWAIRAVAAAADREAVAVGALLLVLAGAAGFATRPYDLAARATSLDPSGEATMDLAAYRWVRAETPPGAVFVNDGDGEVDGAFDAGAFAVMAAGRKLMATHRLFSNPYVDWTAREIRRQAALAWLAGRGDAPACAAFATGLWAILRPETPVAAGRGTEAFRSPIRVVYRLAATGCAP